MSTVKWMVFGPVDVAHSEKFPLHQRHLKKMNCWTRDLWLLVSLVAGVTPLARLQNLPHPQSCCSLGPLLHNSHCPQTVQIYKFRDRNLVLLRTLIVDCLLKNEYLVRLIITQLEQAVMQ